MNAKRILCPVDFSAFSDSAVGYASTLAQEAGAKLYLVHVDESQVPYDAGYAGYIPQLDPEAIKEKLAEVQPTLAGIETEHVMLSGRAADALVDFANDHDIDLIVMGTHGRTGVARLVMGSIAEAVVRHAACPVLTVKLPARVAAKG